MSGIPRADFVHDWPSSRVVFGHGQVAAVPSEVARLGARRVQLICDPAASTAADRVVESLGAALVVDRIDEVVMHVPSPVAREAARRATETAADLVVCIGGGSATGLAKGVAKFAGLPVLAIPTTYAGSEMTSVYGLTDGGKKVTGRLEGVRPRTVVYDPDLTVGLPLELSVTSGLNAVAHCVEALYAPAPSPMAQAAAGEGIRALATALDVLTLSADDPGGRGLALRGAWLAGWVLNVSEMGLHHRLCHVLGGLLDLPHSPLHAVVLPYVTAFTAPVAPAAMRLLVSALPGAGDDPADAGGAVWDLSTRLGAPTSLAELGVGEEDLDRAITAAVDSVGGRPPVHPRGSTAATLRALITAAWTGERPPPGLGPP
ncbi:maleylacetate reductase [Umezawaea sp. NPDC059074]|uniref:maleylacetate reductase n=1 Tax=Umezawaea sp. NPDC059074 TaxID=3346716 RepID=UPI00367D5376